MLQLARALQHQPLYRPTAVRTAMFALSAYKQGQAPTLSRQKELPRLPVPPLDKSLERYIKSLRPLLLQQALQDGTGEESVEAGIKQRQEWAEDFETGLGRLLQERLKGELLQEAARRTSSAECRPPPFSGSDVDRSTPSNWLDDAFWLKCAYHSWRVPLPINSNWWILMADDRGIPEAFRSSEPAKGEPELYLNRLTRVTDSSDRRRVHRVAGEALSQTCGAPRRVQAQVGQVRSSRRSPVAL